MGYIMKKFTLKNIITLIVGLLILFIPTYIAIANYKSQKAPLDEVSNITTLTIQDPEGRTTVITSDNDPDGVIEMFNNINKSGTPTATLPDSMAGSGFLLVTYIQQEQELSYKYYFSNDSSKCYFADPSGKIYKIAVVQAKVFLGSQYSVYLYKTATPPVLTASQNNVINALELNWYYLVSGGTYQQFDYQLATNEQITYDIGNNFSFNFDIVPTYSNLKVYNGDILLFDGGLDSLTNLNLNRNTLLNFVISASWEQTSECQYYGTAKYTFNALVLAPAEFKIGETEIEHGDVLVLSGVNVTDPGDIRVSFEPALPNNYSPFFFTDGEYVHALIPFSYDVPNGEYKITVSYGITTQEFTLNIIKARYGFDKAPSNSAASESLISTYYSEQDIAEYKTLKAEIVKSTETLKYFSGAFINYENAGTLTSKKSTIKLGFSREQILKDGRTFKHDGIDFEVSAGVDVPVMASGKVAYVGFCDVLGNFVVVDHGYGLKSWYAHLSESYVSVGDILTTSQPLGKTGNTGFITENRLHIEFTVFNVPVAPFSLWDEGLIFPTFD